MKKMLKIIVLVIVALPVLVLVAGQAGLLRGTRPGDIGVHDHRLKPPGANSQNVVSSQAALHPHLDYHVIAPLRVHRKPEADMVRLQKIVAAMPGAHIVTSSADYFHAEFESKTLRFVDDVEFMLDSEKNEIQMRSASRIGRKDFGVNRARLEQVRQLFDAS